MLREIKKGEGFYISSDLTVQVIGDELALRNELKKKSRVSKCKDGRVWVIKKGRVVEKR